MHPGGCIKSNRRTRRYALLATEFRNKSRNASSRFRGSFLPLRTVLSDAEGIAVSAPALRALDSVFDRDPTSGERHQQYASEEIEPEEVSCEKFALCTAATNVRTWSSRSTFRQLASPLPS